jgi:hypothetical protein
LDRFTDQVVVPSKYLNLHDDAGFLMRALPRLAPKGSLIAPEFRQADGKEQVMENHHCEVWSPDTMPMSLSLCMK